ncbi:hypothetical protein M407DRAFT_33944, partial [Tulasnella calospora MUT 4182]
MVSNANHQRTPLLRRIVLFQSLHLREPPGSPTIYNRMGWRHPQRPARHAGHLPSIGTKLRVGTPPNPKYHASSAVWDNIKEVGCEKGIFWTDDPRAAVKGADAVVTDTWY